MQFLKRLLSRQLHSMTCHGYLWKGLVRLLLVSDFPRRHQPITFMVPNFPAVERIRSMSYVSWRTFALFVAIAGASLPSIAQAQIMIDMSRITCSEYFALPPNQARMLAAWMSGWFNQKMGYVWVDLDAYARNVANVRLWCETYPDQLVMNGLQRATGK